MPTCPHAGGAFRRRAMPPPAPPSPCSWTTAPRRRRRPLRARAARAAAAEIRPGAFCALHSAATPHENPVTSTDFSCAARRLWRASLYPARFSTPQYNSRCLFARVRFFLYCVSGDGPINAPTPAAPFSAAPCPRRLCPWGPPRHTPTGAPGGLPHHALTGALVFRRPRRPRPARGQQPHVDGAGR